MGVAPEGSGAVKKSAGNMKSVIVVIAFASFLVCRYHQFLTSAQEIVAICSGFFVLCNALVEWNYPSRSTGPFAWTIIDTFSCVCVLNMMMVTVPFAYRVANIDTFSPFGSDIYNEMVKYMKMGDVLVIFFLPPFMIFVVVQFLLLNVPAFW